MTTEERRRIWRNFADATAAMLGDPLLPEQAYVRLVDEIDHLIDETVGSVGAPDDLRMRLPLVADALEATAAEEQPASYEEVRREFVSALREFAAHPQTSEKMRDLATQWYTVVIKDDVRRAREQELAEFEKLKKVDA